MTDPSQMVTVHLDQQRMYRANHEDTKAITVGPGEVEVPAWVAEHWATSEAPQPETPVAEVDTVSEIALLRAEVADLRALVDQLISQANDAPEVETYTNSPIVLTPLADDQLQYLVDTNLPIVAQKETGKRKKD